MWLCDIWHVTYVITIWQISCFYYTLWYMWCHITLLCCGNHQSQRPIVSQASKSLRWMSSGNFTRELDKEPSLHCSSIYTTTSWSMLQQCVYLMSIHYVSTLRLPCFLHVPWHHTFNLRCTCVHHVYTMRNYCPLTSLLTLTPSRLFPILLDPKFFQTILASVTWLPGHVPISYISSPVVD